MFSSSLPCIPNIKATLIALVLAFFALLPAACLAQTKLAGIDSSKGIEFFESKIRPALVKHCYQCHSLFASADFLYVN